MDVDKKIAINKLEELDYILISDEMEVDNSGKEIVATQKQTYMLSLKNLMTTHKNKQLVRYIECEIDDEKCLLRYGERIHKPKYSPVSGIGDGKGSGMDEYVEVLKKNFKISQHLARYIQNYTNAVKMMHDCHYVV